MHSFAEDNPAHRPLTPSGGPFSRLPVAITGSADVDELAPSARPHDHCYRRNAGDRIPVGEGPLSIFLRYSPIAPARPVQGHEPSVPSTEAIDSNGSKAPAGEQWLQRGRAGHATHKPE